MKELTKKVSSSPVCCKEQNRKFMKSISRAVVTILLGMISNLAYSQRGPNDLKVWFSRPAATWNEALPVGNGTLGAMVFGGIANERLQLNESSVWTGGPEDFVNPQAKSSLPEVRRLLFEGKYAEAQKLAQKNLMGSKNLNSTYQTLGDLHLEFTLPPGEPAEYKRELDLDTAISRVSYKVGGVTFTREVFSSAPDQALVVRITASKPGALNFTVRLSRPGNKAGIELVGNKMAMTEHVGDGKGVNMIARLNVRCQGGSCSSVDSVLSIAHADTVTLFLTAATDYRGINPGVVSENLLSSVSSKNYDEIRSRHVADYQQYFRRVDFNIGSTDAVYFPTDARIAAVQQGNTDPSLIRLYYQFGRYLLISSSRPGGLPANLQGLWADGLTPPWSADYHININIQMNYWPSEITNLSEMHLPFLAFINELIPDGRKTARDMYGLKGAVAHFATDPWHFTETYGMTQWGMWPMGLAWCAQHLWEHFLFTGDTKHLREVGYPIMKEAARFCRDWLVENPSTRMLVSGPSISPENRFRTKNGDTATMVMGPTMDHMIIRDLFNNTIAASTLLRRDFTFRKSLRQSLSRLAPTRIGSDGRIMEWTEEFEEPEPGHRHISHLFGLYPGKEITDKDPALIQAARKTLEYRLQHGGGHTGWSRAWIINFYARLHNGDAAYQNILALLQKSTLPNLFDNHPPFQIDGNFGAVAGITEMLLQSHTGEVDLLPALPSAWPSGCIHGIMARGGFEVYLDWTNGRLSHVTILSKLGNDCHLQYDSKVVSFSTEKGKSYSFDGELNRL